MAAFDSQAFDVQAFDENAFDFGSAAGQAKFATTTFPWFFFGD